MRRKHVSIVTGAGMETWFTERLVASLTAALEHPVSALVALIPSTSGVKFPGVVASQNVVLAARPVVYLSMAIFGQFGGRSCGFRAGWGWGRP